MDGITFLLHLHSALAAIFQIRKKSRSTLLQTQKKESIGVLACGKAHDFIIRQKEASEKKLLVINTVIRNFEEFPAPPTS
jgi:hypothetical protein